MALNFGLFFLTEELRLDGSNFAEWYLLLRDSLQNDNLLYVIDGPLGDQPNDYAREEVRKEWHDRYGMYARVEWPMCTRMTYDDLRVQFNNTRANEIINGIKILFGAQVRVAGYKCLDEFLSTVMEEKTCLDQHLVRMHQIHRRLMHVWNYWVPDEWAMDIVLRPLPLSYKSFVCYFVMKGE